MPGQTKNTDIVVIGHVDSAKPAYKIEEINKEAIEKGGMFWTH